MIARRALHHPLSWLLGLAFGMLTAINLWEGDVLLGVAWAALGAGILLGQESRLRPATHSRSLAAWATVLFAVVLLGIAAVREHG